MIITPLCDNAAMKKRSPHTFLGGIEGKVCTSRCAEWKALNEFRKCSANRDGLDYSCAECKRADQSTPRYRAWRRKHQADRLSTDDNFKIKRRLTYELSNCIGAYARKGECSEKMAELLGCSWLHFVRHIESLFLPGMSWENYGKGGWELDHIKAYAQFDLTDEAQLRECCHYTNTQPLWAPDNLIKSNQ